MADLEFALTSPCGNCPFRSDKEFYLPKERRVEIVGALENDKTFACHKTTDGRKRVEQHCAGALIALHKANKLYNNFMLRLAAMAGLFDHNKLRMDSPVQTLKEFTSKDN